MKPLPLALRHKKGLIVLKNQQSEKCFLYAVAVALLVEPRNSARVKKVYDKCVSLLPPDFLRFPVTYRDVVKFEKQTPISVNIYGFSRADSLFPYYVSPLLAEKEFHVDLLLHGEHYYGIKSLSALLGGKKVNRRKMFVCRSCLHYFVNEE